MSRIAASVLLALALAGCGTAAEEPAGSGSGAQLFEKRATAVAAAWTDSSLLTRWRTAFVAAEHLTREPDWTPRGSLKAAFYGGWARTSVALPDQAGTGTIAYADGTRLSVRTLGAQAAYDAMLNPRSGECPPPEDGSGGCDWLTVTGATATSLSIQTARGRASVPAWSFTVEGLREPIVRVAVDRPAEVSDFEPRLGPTPTDGRRLLLNGQDIVSQDGTALTVALGSGSCDTGIEPHLLETDTVVVVGGTALGPNQDQVCDAMLRIHEVRLDTAAPVGSRPVLDAASGRPLLPRMVPVS